MNDFWHLPQPSWHGLTGPSGPEQRDRPRFRPLDPVFFLRNARTGPDGPVWPCQDGKKDRAPFTQLPWNTP